MRYRIFGQTGLRVSGLVLGTGNFGTQWGHGAKPEDARRVFDAYIAAGGNFIDTADAYQFGESETLLGTFLEGKRDSIVLATKFTLGSTPNAGVFTTGNSRKAMIASAEGSLKRLKTDHIDLYWAHFPDSITPIEEILRGFDDLARAGKILHAGLSNFPAWRVSRAATIAELRGTLPIAAIQVEHSLVERTTEHDLLPMAKALGLGVVAWSPLGGGMLTGKYRRGEKGRAEGFGGRVFQAENSAQRTAVLDAVIAIAEEHRATPSQVAIAWVATKGGVPIIGPRSIEQIEDNLGAVDLKLTEAEIARLDAVSAIPAPFPHRMLVEMDGRGKDANGEPVSIDAPILPVA